MRKYHLLSISIVVCLMTVLINPALAAVSHLFTINLSEVVNVDTTGGIPRIAVDVGGVTRYAAYTAGTGTSALTFTYNAVIGDVDLDGVALSSPIQLNAGTIKDAAGNDATLTFTPPNTTGVKVNYPSLGMDFVADADGRYTLNGTVYNDLPSFLTATGGAFTRASIGTYYDSSGTLQTVASGVPRFDYDPVTLQPKGILIEESRTNLLLRSSEFDNAAWTAVSAKRVTASATLSPSGQYDAYEISDTTASYEGIAPSSITVANNSSTYIISIYVLKTFGGTAPRFGANASLTGGGTPTFLNLRINTDTGIATGGGAAVSSVGAWWRVSGQVVNNSTGNTALGIGIYPAAQLPSGGSDNPSATGTATIYGAQIEVGAFPTSYIPTTTAAVTRNADSLLIPTGGWFGTNVGTLITQSILPNGTTGASFPGTATLGDGSVNNRHFLYLSPTNLKQSQTRTAGVIEFLSTTGVYTNGATLKQGLAFAPNNVRSVMDGNLSPLDTAVILPNITTLFVGDNGIGGKANGTINKLKYYPLRVSDAQLQLLTQ